jgi:tetratricopeptide (TPR) repeat protein
MLAPVILTLFQFAATLPQTSGEWCKPVIINVTGKVTVNCTGIDPRALDVLNAELARANVELNEKVRRANLWAERYKQVEKSLEEAGVTSELARTAQDYLRRGALKEAGEVLDRIIAQEGKVLPRLASDHFSRALVFELKLQPADALTHLERAHRFAPRDWRYAAEYSLLLAEQHRTSDQLALFGDMMPALSPSSKFAAEDVPYAAQVMVSFAQYCTETGRTQEAAQSYELAFNGLLPLVRIDPSRYFLLWIQIATNLGTVYMRAGKFEEADAKLVEALTLETVIAEGDPDSMAPRLARTYMIIGETHRARHQASEALDAYNKGLEALNKVISKDPERYKPEGAEIALKIARLQADSGHSQLAGAILQADLDLIRDLAKRDAIQYGPELADALDMLAAVDASQEKFGEAVKASEESILLWRKAVEVSPDTALPSLDDALLHEAQFFSLSGQMDQAQKAADEAWNVARQIEAIKLPISGQAKASALTILARVAVQKKGLASGAGVQRPGA